MSEYESATLVEVVGDHLYFYAETDPEHSLALVKLLREAENRLALTHYPVPIWLHINSPGGDLFSALAVADTLSHCTVPVHSIAEGLCASGATLLSVGCTKRYIMPNAFMLIHQLSSQMWGTHEDFVDELEFQKLAMARLTAFYREHSKLSEKQLQSMMQHNTWITATEAVKYGLADQLFSP